MNKSGNEIVSIKRIRKCCRFLEIYTIYTQALNSGSKSISIFWQQNVLHVFKKKNEILFFREIIFGWAAPSTSELRRVNAASWPPFRQTVLAGFASPFAGRWRALPALRIHKMLHHRVHRHMHVRTYTCARLAYLSTWSSPRRVRTVITSSRYAHGGMHAFTATWTHERRIAVWSNGVREGTAAMRLCTRAVVYVSLRVTAVELNAIAPTGLLFKRARTPAHAKSCEFLLRANTLKWIGRWSTARALITLCRRLRRY